MTTYDLVLHGGRLVDPAAGIDGTRDIGIMSGRVAEVSVTPLEGATVVDVTGLVVAPGFIDLHSHCDGVPGHRLQVMDGVTTALELEAGVHPVEKAYERAAAEGRPCNYGFSASWATARLVAMAGVIPTGAMRDVVSNMGLEVWKKSASKRETGRILDTIDTDLAAGALGIGIMIGYAPMIDPNEYLAVAKAAASASRPTFTHARDLVEHNPAVPIDGAEEIARTAGETGAHMHYCHVNSTSLRHVDRVHAVIQRARSEGATISTEAYPYGTGMTGIGAAHLAPDVLHQKDITAHAIQHASSGHRMADIEDFARMRRDYPDDWMFIHFLDESDPESLSVLRRAMLFDDTAVASDAIPPIWPDREHDPYIWPLPKDVVTHPRTAGTYSKILRSYVRDTGAFSLSEAIRRCSLIPAKIAAKAAPAMRRKGRLSAGSDADIVVFDPMTVSDNATYSDTTRPASGFIHVFVNGCAVVEAGELVTSAFPGKPVRA